MYPAELVSNYHTVTCGQPLLKPWEAGDLWEDYFLPDAEPRVRRASKADAPDCPGKVEGELYHRGNTRWEMTIERWVYFGVVPYPITEFDIETGLNIIIWNTPEEHAQSWMWTHLNALPDGNQTLLWNGHSFPSCVLNAEGRTFGPFVVLSYSAELSKAAV